MTKLNVYSLDGKVSSGIEASDAIFSAPENIHLVNETLHWYLASQRRGIANAKTRAEVSGGGRKPWKQKGTGRARIGDNRAPHWRKGGVVFPPKPRDYSYSLPLKVRKAAIRIVLSDKARSGNLKIVNNLELANPKTKDMAKLLKTFGDKGVLIVTPKKDELIKRVSANIKNVSVLEAKTLNVHDLLKHQDVVMMKDALPLLEEAYK